MINHFKKIVIIPIAMLGLSMLSCGLYTWYEDANYFREAGGVIIGTPVKNNNGTWFLPIKFHTRIINSAHMFKDVKVYLKNDTIKIRLLVGLAQSGHHWSKGANLGKLLDGMYQIQYLNSDGSTVDIGKIEIQN